MACLLHPVTEDVNVMMLLCDFLVYENGIINAVPKCTWFNFAKKLKKCFEIAVTVLKCEWIGVCVGKTKSMCNRTDFHSPATINK